MPARLTSESERLNRGLDGGAITGKCKQPPVVSQVKSLNPPTTRRSNGDPRFPARGRPVGEAMGLFGSKRHFVTRASSGASSCGSAGCGAIRIHAWSGALLPRRVEPVPKKESVSQSPSWPTALPPTTHEAFFRSLRSHCARCQARRNLGLVLNRIVSNPRSGERGYEEGIFHSFHCYHPPLDTPGPHLYDAQFPPLSPIRSGYRHGRT